MSTSPTTPHASAALVTALALVCAANSPASALAKPKDRKATATARARPPAKPKVELLTTTASVKIVRITLAVGGVLPLHTTPVHATVAAMAGQGTVTLGAAQLALPTHGAVFLPKQVPHAVTNTGKRPLVLLVHHLLIPPRQH